MHVCDNYSKPTHNTSSTTHTHSHADVPESMMPHFAELIPNITVTLGSEALLGCVVDNLNRFQVAWVRVDTQTILSIHHSVITQNDRVSLTYNDHRSWYLHISKVEETDRGWYMCQVNTDPMRSRKGYLQVVGAYTKRDRSFRGRYILYTRKRQACGLSFINIMRF